MCAAPCSRGDSPQPGDAIVVVVIVADGLGRVVAVAVRASDPDEHAASSTTTATARDVRTVWMVREGTGVDRGEVLWEPTGDSALDTFAAKAREWGKRGDAYIFMINGAKVRAPAAALALQERLR